MEGNKRNAAGSQSPTDSQIGAAVKPGREYVQRGANHSYNILMWVVILSTFREYDKTIFYKI